jgi:hypothetical protein
LCQKKAKRSSKESNSLLPRGLEPTTAVCLNTCCSTSSLTSARPQNYGKPHILTAFLNALDVPSLALGARTTQRHEQLHNSTAVEVAVTSGREVSIRNTTTERRRVTALDTPHMYIAHVIRNSTFRNVGPPRRRYKRRSLELFCTGCYSLKYRRLWYKPLMTWL